MLDIDADAGRGMGLFENIHDAKSAKAFADQTKGAALRFYGTAFREFVRLLCAIEPDLRLYLIRSYQEAFVAACPLDCATPEVGRAASRMALLAAAGEIAIELGVLPWPEGAAIDGVATCFRAWRASRGGDHIAHDDARAIEQVRLFIERYGPSRFQTIFQGKVPAVRDPTKADPEPTLVRDRAGFRRQTADGGTEFLFLREIFKSEICNGYDANMVLNALDKRGFLQREAPAMTRNMRLPGLGSVRVYCISGAIVEGDL